jgi:NitT/TauT family transport system substrate-binding protein
MSRTMTRRTALTTAALVVSSSRTVFAQAALVTVRVATSPNDDLSAVLYAQQSGMLKAVGIDLTIQKVNNGSYVAAAIVGGAVDIGKVSTIPIITGHVRQIPFTIVYPNKLNIVGKTVTGALVVAPDSPIRTGRDLNDKTIAVGALLDSTWVGARAWMDAHGGDSTTVKYIEITFSAVAAALKSGRIAAGSLGQPYITAQTTTGEVRLLGDVTTAIAPRVLQSAWVSTTEYVGRNRDVVAKFARVVAEAARYCNAHPAEIIPITAAFTGIEPATLATMKTIYATEPDPRDVQPWIDACVKYKVIPQRFDAKELYA